VQPPEVPRSAPLSGKSNTRRPVPAAGWLRGVGLYGRSGAMRRSREPQQPADGAITTGWSAATGAVPCDFAVPCAYAVRREPCGLFPAGLAMGRHAGGSHCVRHKKSARGACCAGNAKEPAWNFRAARVVRPYGFKPWLRHDMYHRQVLSSRDSSWEL